MKNNLALILGCALFLGTGFAQSGGQGAAAGSGQSSGQGVSSGHDMGSATGKGMSSKGSAADTKFAHDAAAGGKAEVELGKLASEKGSSDKVKQFAQRMVTDHSKAGDELKTLASQKGMTIPDAPDAKSQAMMAKLSKLSGAAFDKAYMQDMLKDHQKDVAEFQKEANSGSDPDLKKLGEHYASGLAGTSENGQRSKQFRQRQQRINYE